MLLSRLLWILALQAAAAAGTDVRGKIVLKTGNAEGGIDVRAGEAGGEGAGIPVVDSKVPMFRSFGSVRWGEAKGLTFHYKKLAPGMRLITVAWRLNGAPSARVDTSLRTHYVDWRWVDTTPSDPKETSPEIVLTIQPSACGDAEVTLDPGISADSVSFMPCDGQGKVPSWDDRRGGPAFTEKVRDGKAMFKGMKPGKYAFYPTLDLLATGAPTVLAVGEVVENGVAAVTLAAEK